MMKAPGSLSFSRLIAERRREEVNMEREEKQEDEEIGNVQGRASLIKWKWLRGQRWDK